MGYFVEWLNPILWNIKLSLDEFNLKVLKNKIEQHSLNDFLKDGRTHEWSLSDNLKTYILVNCY